MINLNDIDLMIARGRYSTIRAAHEDAKHALSKLCGQLGATAAQVLRRMQPDNDDVPESVADLMEGCRNTLTLMDACVAEIEELAKQRATLKGAAWGKRP
jgi:hypothetical protein